MRRSWRNTIAVCENIPHVAGTQRGKPRKEAKKPQEAPCQSAQWLLTQRQRGVFRSTDPSHKLADQKTLSPIFQPELQPMENDRITTETGGKRSGEAVADAV